MEWYEELDFDDNPFDVNPKKFSDKLVGLEDIQAELIYRIASGSIVFIEGKKGFGKTSLLWNVIKKYRGLGRVIYVDCENLEEGLNIEHLLQARNDFLRRLLNKKPNGMILLLDNVSELSKRNMERIKYYFDEEYLHSVVLTGVDYNSIKFSDSFKDRIGKRIISLKELEPYQAVSLVRNRIGDSQLITDSLIEEVFNKATRNPLTLLEKLEELFSMAVENKKEKIQKEDLRSI